MDNSNVKKKEKDNLETSVLKLLHKLSYRPGHEVVAPSLTYNELKGVLADVAGFIDFVKFELGEDIDAPADAPEETQTVKCKLCTRQVCSSTAHMHDGEWVGDNCCWDERLKSTE